MNFWRDLRFALRTLARAKGVSLVAVLTLGLGIGLNTAMFSGVAAYLWSPFPYTQPEQLMWLSQSNAEHGFHNATASWLDIEDWRTAKSFDAIAGYGPQRMALSGRGDPRMLTAIAATPELFAVLRIAPVQGRAFTRGEEHDRLAVLSDALWRREFRADPGAIGREIRLEGNSYSIIGVLAADFTFLYQDADLIIPLDLSPKAIEWRGNRFLAVIGRLRAGATVGQARAEIQAISARTARENPDSNAGWVAELKPLEDELIPPNSRVGAYTVLLAVGFVLLIACTNIASLLLARGTLRRRELAIRASLGASRRAVAGLLLADSAVLAVAGGALGILLAHWTLPLIKRLAPPDTPRYDMIALDPRTLAYALGLSVATALFAGIAPAWLLSRRDLVADLGGSGRGSGGRQRALRLFVVAEVAISAVLLAAAGLMIRSLQSQIHASPGFDTRNLLMAGVSLPEARYSAPAQAAEFFEQAVARLRADPRVRDAAAADMLPLAGGSVYQLIAVEGRPVIPGEQNIAARAIVTPGYFRTLGIRILAGRAFDETDTADRPPIAIVNETMAQRYFGGVADAVAHRFRVGDKWFSVAGVVADVRHESAALPARPQFFLPHAQRPSRAMTLFARTTVTPLQAAGALRAAVWALDREQPLERIESLEDVLWVRRTNVRLMAQILSFLAGLALLLAAIGIYGSIAHMVGQRTQELGVRIALGAQRADIFRSVLANGMALAAAGLAIGAACAWAVTPVLRNIFSNIRPHDPLTFAAAAAILLAAGVAACVIPARRAMAVDPAETLRAE